MISTPGPVGRRYIERWKSCSVGLPSHTVFSQGDGIWLKDVDGKVYMDFASQSAILGHRNPRLTAAIRDQMRKSGLSQVHGLARQQIEIVEKLREILPPNLSAGRFYCCNTGSEACEYSMEVARAYTRKPTLLAYLGGHYGWTIGALSLTADWSESRRFCLPLIPEIVHIPYPYCYRCPIGHDYPDCGIFCLRYLENVLETMANPEEIAAVFMEPIQQVGGVVLPPREYVTALKDLCEKHGILMVVDEVATGFGRTGKMFAKEHWDVLADIMFMGKAFGSGIPMGALAARRGILERNPGFPLYREWSPVSCVAALATIEELQSRKLPEKSAQLGDHMIRALRQLSDEHRLVGDIRGKGLLIGIELVKDHEKRKPATEEASRVAAEAFKRGLILGCVGTHRHVIRLTPPLIMSREDSDRAVMILDEALRAVEKRVRE